MLFLAIQNDKAMINMLAMMMLFFETCLGEQLDPYIQEVNLYNSHCCSYYEILHI